MGVGEQLLDVMARIEAKLDRVLAQKPAQASPSGGAIAPDSELDSQYGDPVVRKDPPRWTGDSFSGRPFSECSAEFLDVLAEFKEWQAAADERKAPSLADDEREKKLKYARYGRSDAARARGWAARIRRGWTPPASRPMHSSMPPAGPPEPYNGDW